MFDFLKVNRDGNLLERYESAIERGFNNLDGEEDGYKE